MKRLSILLACATAALAQIPNPTQQVPQTERGTSSTSDSMPVYKVTVVQRSTRAISYRFRSGWTKVDLQGTNLAPEAKGHVEVNSRNGYIEVKAEASKLQPATRFGPEYLTYVLWAVTPQGRPKNLGEFRLDGDSAKVDVTTDLQSFGLIVTAEPYFAVSVPSDVVVMENIVRDDTVGKIEYVDAKYDLLQRGQYTLNVAPGKVRPMTMDTKTPPELFQARNAVQIARWTGADRYATDTFNQADALLKQAEQYSVRKERKPAQMTAREAAQKAEDARIITIRRMDEERLANERQASADREAASKAQADAEAARRAQADQARAQADQMRAQADTARLQAEQARSAAEAERMAAERAKAEAQSERAAADKARAEAEMARQSAVQQQQAAMSDAEKARLQAQDADRMRIKAEQDRDQLRQQLLQQLNMVLETRETARGLIVNMSDVLFDTAKYTLKPGAREKLSKISGIVLAHPGLKLEVEGHTDNVGGDEYNQKLSEQRASAVRDYLVQQGLNSGAITFKGFGKTQPVADNGTAAGRQQNRRVELVVSGDIIGTKVQSMRMTTSPQTPQQ